MRRAGVHVGILVVLSFVWLAIDRGPPLVRNGLVDARAAWNVVVYYRDAQQHVFERDGFLRSDLSTRT
jgi:hypothetical protein